MRGLEKEISTYKKIIKFGRGFIDILMESGEKIRYSGGTLAWRNNNPGNLKYGNFAKKHRSIGAGSGNHAVFPTYDIGKQAMIALLFGKGGHYEKLTVLRAISRYAPTSDPNANNQPLKYANWISKRTGIPTSMVLNQLSDQQRDDFVEAMIVYEGFKVGKITRL